MNQAVNLRIVLTGGLLVASAFTCDAMSLGLARGVIWIGQPLDLSVQVKLEPGEDVASLCVAADVLYADNLVSSGQVRVFAEPGKTSGEATVRIRSTLPVDEPVVNIYLKAGCGAAVTRRYVLLAEVPVDYTAPGMQGASRGSTIAAATAPGPRPDTGGLVSGPGVARPGGRAGSIRIPRASASTTLDSLNGGSVDSKSAGSAAASRPTASPAPVRSVVRKPAPEERAGKSRLRLDPADLLIERDPVLRASTELFSVPQEQDGGSRRAEAAALWRAINATPEEVLRDTHRIQALQDDLAALRTRNQKSEAAVAELRLQVQQAQSERYGNGLVYGLVAAFLAALGVAGYFWSRSQRQAKERHWWGMAADDAAQGDEKVSGVENAPGRGVAIPSDVLDGKLDIDLSAASPSFRSEDTLAAQPGLAVLDSGDFQTSLTGAGRAVKVEELLDIQQQADFFISLGQYDQAVATLRNHIADNVQTSALAYLDLLKIYHLQGREKDYALVRKEFNDVFNAEVPEFAAFDQQTRGLQSYQSAMSRITGLWPTPKVLDVIEESIFRKPGQGNQVFDLEAYRELLMLYSIAKEIVEERGPGPAFESSGAGLLASTEQILPTSQDTESDRPDFKATKIQPLPTVPLPTDNAFKVPPSANLGLDIDLSELAPTSAERPPAPAPATTAKPKAADSHLIDFDIFDMATRAHSASRRGKP